MQLIALLILLIIPPLDAARDAWLDARHTHVSWWTWHLVKWMAFYPPLFALGFAYFVWQEMAFLAFIGLVSWRLTYVYLKNRAAQRQYANSLIDLLYPSE